MRLAGAQRLRLDDAGALVVATGPGEVTLTPPAAFQGRDGVRYSVKAAYALHGREYGFRLSDYDHALPVLIDPLLQATYLGGSDSDIAFALAIHPTTVSVRVQPFFLPGLEPEALPRESRICRSRDTDSFSPGSEYTICPSHVTKTVPAKVGA